MWRKLVLLLLLSSPSLWAACENTIPASTPSGQLNNNNDGTISDAKTGLMWKQCNEGSTPTDCLPISPSFTWQQALQQPQTLNASGGFAGHSDWRLPNIKELRSIVEEQCFSPSINSAFFPNTAGTVFWSSSPHAGDAAIAWYVDFNFGRSGSSLRTHTWEVRLVRGGQ